MSSPSSSPTSIKGDDMPPKKPALGRFKGTLFRELQRNLTETMTGTEYQPSPLEKSMHAEDAERRAYKMLFGGTRQEQDKRWEYLRRIFLGWRCNQNGSITISSTAPAVTGLEDEETKATFRELADSFSNMKRETDKFADNVANLNRDMRELAKTLQEITEKLDNHRYQLNKFQQCRCENI